jgi:hypothetical protein
MLPMECMNNVQDDPLDKQLRLINSTQQ